MSRRENTTPNSVCANPTCRARFYREPSSKAKYKEVYCSLACRWNGKRKPTVECAHCRESFTPPNRRKAKRKFCGRACQLAYYREVGISGERNGTERSVTSTSPQKVGMLLRHGVSYVCSVQGCTYDKALEVHRYTPGREGGEYKVGNAYLLCPNHHAEVEREFITLVKLDDHTLAVAGEHVPERYAQIGVAA